MSDNQVIVMTVGLLKEFAHEVIREFKAVNEDKTPEVAETEYVYGLRGIRELFNVSHATAQRYKDTFLQPAISQRGRKITVDTALARSLFDEHKKEQ